MKNERYEKALNESSEKASKLNAEKIVYITNKANKMAVNIKYLKKVADELKTMIAMFKQSLSKKSGFKLDMKEIAIITGALLYLVMPLDIIPDFLIPFGFADDVSVIGVAANQLFSALNRFKTYQEVNNHGESIEQHTH